MKNVLAWWTGIVAIGIGVSLGAAQPAPVDLSGTWTLDTTLSDTPEQVSASIRGDLGQIAGGESLFGEDVDALGRGGRGGGSNRGGNRQRGRADANSKPNADEQKRIDDLTSPLRYPPPTLTIAQSATGVTLTESPDKSRTLTTNDKREKQTIASTQVDVTSRWEGPQLVEDVDLGGGRRMRYTYSIVPTTKQLLIRVAIDRTPGRAGPFEIRFVYDRAPS